MKKGHEEFSKEFHKLRDEPLYYLEEGEYKIVKD